MKRSASFRRFLGQVFRGAVALFCVPLIALGDPALLPGQAQQPAGTTEQAPQIPSDQLDSLVAPIALYPDELLAQVLAASTYPLEIVQLQQFLSKNPNLKDKALVDAVGKQNWDPTVQSLAAFPEVVKRLADDIQWTTDLGNAVLAQQSDVMDAVQRMRKKAEDKGALKSDEKLTVETKVEGSKDVIVIESANPQVVYVPSYDPTVVYGAPVYPYPPIYYPPYYAGGLFLSFGIGVAMGAAWGGWCCGAGWGGNNININNENNFVRNSERNSNRSDRGGGNRGDRGGGNRGAGDRGGGNNWSHNPQHRGGTPYSNRATADKFGGTTRGDRGNRAGAGQGAGQLGGRQQAGVSNRANPGLQNRPGGGNAADRVGGQNVSRTGGGGRDSFSGGPRGGYNGRNAGQSSRRGSSSLGSSRGGGGARGGGGGARGGGGGGRGGRR